MNSTDYSVLLVLGLLDDNKKAPNGEDFKRKKYKQTNDNINPPSDVMTRDDARKMFKP